MSLSKTVLYEATCRDCGARSKNGDGSHLVDWLSVSSGPAVAQGMRSSYLVNEFHLCPTCAQCPDVVELLKPIGVWGEG